MATAEFRAAIRALAQEYLRDPDDEFPGNVWFAAQEWCAASKPSDRSQMLDAWAQFAFWDDELDAVFLGERDALERARIHHALRCAAEKILADEQWLPPNPGDAD
jgi:hypothetical protein